MAEHCLLHIIDAADPEDGDDVAIRRLLVSALRDSGIELTRTMSGRVAPPPHRRGTRAFAAAARRAAAEAARQPPLRLAHRLVGVAQHALDEIGHQGALADHDVAAQRHAGNEAGGLRHVAEVLRGDLDPTLKKGERPAPLSCWVKEPSLIVLMTPRRCRSGHRRRRRS